MSLGVGGAPSVRPRECARLPAGGAFGRHVPIRDDRPRFLFAVVERAIDYSQ